MAASAADAANRQLVFTRVFAAPRELVYQAWTDPGDHLAAMVAMQNVRHA